MTPYDLFTRRRTDPELVARPIAAGDVTPGMRVTARGQVPPMTIIPDGARSTGAMVTLTGMDDAGDLVTVACPVEWMLSEVLDPPRLDLADTSCSCGAPDCPGHWTALDHDPRGPNPSSVLLRIAGGTLLGFSPPTVDVAIDPGRHCHDEDCSAGPTEPEADRDVWRGPPGASHDGYL